MDIAMEKTSDVAVVTPRSDYLDASVVEEFKRDMAPLLEANRQVLLDMSSLQFVDSAGLGAILSCLRRVSAAEGDLKLFGLSKPVRAAFEVARLHRIFDIFPTREEGIQAFAQAH